MSDKNTTHFGYRDVPKEEKAGMVADVFHSVAARYDLMNDVNVRGTFLCSQKCLPHLKKADNPHILNLSPPLSLESKWFAPHVAYTMAKFGMSFCVLGMAAEFRADGIAVNALWPRTAIATSAVKNLLGGDAAVRGEPQTGDHGRRRARDAHPQLQRIHS